MADHSLIVPYGQGYLVHDHSGPTLLFGRRTEYVRCMACTLIATSNPWPLDWDVESSRQYQAQRWSKS